MGSARTLRMGIGRLDLARAIAMLRYVASACGASGEADEVCGIPATEVHGGDLSEVELNLDLASDCGVVSGCSGG